MDIHARVKYNKTEELFDSTEYPKNIKTLGNPVFSRDFFTKGASG